MIPGIVSSGLESWGTSEKSRKNFRKRMWGTMSKFFVTLEKLNVCTQFINSYKKKKKAMFRSVLLDKESWIEHVMLDPVTGLDPPDYKLRAVHGKPAYVGYLKHVSNLYV
jgi:phospholipid:diacylglycerol acyltransferase